MVPYEFQPNQVFDPKKHMLDVVAKRYLEQATSDVHHLVPADVIADGNCLYHSIVLLMNNPAVTWSELRVRTVIELITNETYYSNTYSHCVGPFDIAIQAMCRKSTFSELYEIAALCNLLKCNIRSIYPKIDLRDHTAIVNNTFMPLPPTVANCEITILWSHTLNENEVRIKNNSTWSPNHFVPLMSRLIQHARDNNNQLASVLATPEKKTFKNNAAIQIRIPEFQASPSRRLRSEINIDTDSSQSIMSDTMLHDHNDKEEQRQIRLEKKKERVRSSRLNATEEERQNRLEEERHRSQSIRMNQTKEQRQNRLDADKRRTQSSRMNATEEERQNRLKQQRKRSQANREKKKNEKRMFDNISIQQQTTHMQSAGAEEVTLQDGINISHSTSNSNILPKIRNSTSSWPEPISRDLKEGCLKKFLHRMFMSALAETTCAVCNIRSPMQKSKSVPVSKITGTELLKVSDETKALIMGSQLSNLEYINEGTVTTINADGIQTTDHAQTSKSPSFYCENNIILYTSGLFQQNKKDMCTLCQKCHDALSKKHIPKFSVANGMWFGDIPGESQGLTIPEEKLISLYRHNSCIIKLQSPFHSATTSQTALKGNCITFLQNVPDIVSSLPLKLNDLCDTIKVIFVGSLPPQRIHLRKILTVRKKKIIQALQWLKKYNILYQNIEINLENIAQLPEDDIPESIMSTMEQKISDEEIQSERVGYVPDPLSNLTDYTTSDTIPIQNSSVLDVNGSLVSSDEIANYVLQKMKNNKTHQQMNNDRVHLIPHSSKPVNEYYNPKLLVGLYPTLFCYGRGAPDDQSRPVKTNLRGHIRYLLSYNDRRFETNHSFIFVVFNILQRRNACFHAQLITTKPYFRESAQDIQTLNSKDIETALENISKKTYNSESNSALNKLLNHIKTIGGRVMGSAYSRMALRTRIHSLIYNQCLPNILMTLNPADIHSPIALYFAGVKLDLDNIQMEQLLNTYKRAEIIASHPVATAKFFHLLITNILETIIVDGVLGPIKAYFGTVQSQGRGFLHLHLLIWLDHDMKPADMKEQVQNSTFREKLTAYL
ncbi:unnamed protein product, partial [Adineta steineri]